MRGANNDLFNKHGGKIAGSLIGLVLALLFVIFGFWQGILIIAFILVGALLGSRMELFGEIKNLLNGLWHDRKR